MIKTCEKQGFKNKLKCSDVLQSNMPIRNQLLLRQVKSGSNNDWVMTRLISSYSGEFHAFKQRHLGSKVKIWEVTSGANAKTSEEMVNQYHCSWNTILMRFVLNKQCNPQDPEYWVICLHWYYYIIYIINIHDIAVYKREKRRRKHSLNRV